MKAIWKIIESIALFFLRIGLKIIHRESTPEIEQGFLEFVKFGLVGVSNTVVSYLIYVIALFSLNKAGWIGHGDYIISQVISFVISVLWSFYWNSKFVFTLKEGEERSWFKALIKTYISYSFTGLFLNSILLILWVNLLHIPKMIAPIINLIVSVPINFLINKFWAFKKES